MRRKFRELPTKQWIELTPAEQQEIKLSWRTWSVKNLSNRKWRKHVTHLGGTFTYEAWVSFPTTQCITYERKNEIPPEVSFLVNYPDDWCVLHGLKLDLVKFTRKDLAKIIGLF
jgi:hypothetical protein